MRRTTTLLMFLAAATHSFATIDVSFGELEKTPGRFQLKTVTVKGLFETGGIRNSLWRDSKDREQFDPKKCITVLAHPGFYPGTNLSALSPANLHFVAVTGVVDTRYHGLFGDESFGILLKRLRILPGPRQKQFLIKVDWIRNETDQLLDLDVRNVSSEHKSSLGPRETDSVGVRDTRSVTTIAVKARNCSPLIASFKWRREYYDAEKRCRYFRITPDRIMPVLPAEGRTWKLPPTPERD